MSDNNILKTIGNDLVKAFGTGVSYMIPVVVVGGICLAISLAGGEAGEKGMEVTNPFLKNLGVIGSAGMTMMIPVLAAYISYSIAGKPGLTPGFICGFICTTPFGETGVQTGFLGAMLMGVLSGYLVRWIKKWKVPTTVRAIMPILVIPIVSTVILSMIYFYIIAVPVGMFLHWLVEVLGHMQSGSAIVLGIVIGLMAAIDMGGPCSKAATAFTLALMAEGVYGPNGAFRICVAIPPLGLALSTFVSRRKYTPDEKNLGISALFMGLIGITEGAIPFAVKSIKTVLPSILIGGAVGGALGMLHGVECMVPHGGLIVIAAVNKGQLWYVIDMIIGAIVTAICLHILRPNVDNTKKI